MGSTQPSLRRAFALALSLAVVGATLAAVPAAADTVNPTPASADGLPTAQIDGVVWSQAVAGGIDYLGGSFSHSRPAGSPAGTNETPRRNLLAISVTSGEVVPGFNASTNGDVRAVAAASDGSRIYIAGNFTTVNGQPRNHLAALTPSGQLVPDFAPDVNGPVYGLTVAGSTVYAGGTFTQISGQTRSRVAALTPSGAVLGWAPAVADFAVRAIAVSPNGSTVLLGGSFTHVNGKALNGLAAVTSSTGSSVNWPASSLSQNSGADSAITSLSSGNGLVFATGYAYRSTGNLEGAIAMRWSDGNATWVDNCHGDTYSSVPFNEALYTAGHAHDCSSIGGFVQTANPPLYWHRAIAFSQSAGSNIVQGSGFYNPLYGKPAPNILNWYPDIQGGTYTGQGQGAWSVVASQGYLIYAGEFPTVNGVAQQGIVRFRGVDEGAGTPVATDPTPTPTTDPTTPTAPGATVPAKVATPRTVALGPTAIAVRWSAPKGATADKVSGYVISAFKGGKKVKSVKASASKRLVVLSGLKKSTTYKIAVVAKNAHGSSKLSSYSSSKTKAKGKNVSATKRPAKVSKPGSSVGKAKLRVKWKAASVRGALAVSTYQVRIRLHGKTVKTFTVDDKLRSKLVSSLKRHTTYSVSVRAHNWAGWGSWSTARSVRTR